jgi:hypothetical protein
MARKCRNSLRNAYGADSSLPLHSFTPGIGLGIAIQKLASPKIVCFWHSNRALRRLHFAELNFNWARGIPTEAETNRWREARTNVPVVFGAESCPGDGRMNKAL